MTTTTFFLIKNILFQKTTNQPITNQPINEIKMGVLIFAELADGAIKKSSLEAIFYGAAVAKMQGSTATVLAIGTASADALTKAGNFGAIKVLHANDSRLGYCCSQYTGISHAIVLNQTAIVGV